MGQHYLRAEPRYGSDGVQVSGGLELLVAGMVLGMAFAMLNVAKRPVLARNVFFLGVVVAVVCQVIAGHYYGVGVSCACGGV